METKLHNLLNLSLRPNNAKSKGYIYINDIAIPIEEPLGVTKKFIELLINNNFKLGIPHKKEHKLFGLYIKQTKNNLIKKFSKTTI